MSTAPVTASDIPDTGDIDLIQILRTLWRGKWWIMLCGMIALFLGGYYAFERAVPMYTATATVAFESREEQTLGVDLESVVGGLGGDQATINTEVEVLKSRGLMEKLVTRLDLVNDPEFNARLRPAPGFSLRGLLGQAIGVIRGGSDSDTPAPPPSDEAIFDAVVSTALSKISISNIRQSYVFRITVVTQNPEKSALMANTLADLYILDQLEVKFDATQKATDWLTQRVAVLQQDLETAVEAVKEFNSNSKVTSVEEINALNRQLKDLRDRATTAQNVLKSRQATQAALQAAQDAGDVQALVDLTQDPILKRQLGNVTNGDRTAFDTRVQQILTQGALETSRAENQFNAFRQSVTKLQAQIGEQSEDLIKLQQLEREAEASRLIYEYFLSRLKETSVQEGIQQADSRLLSKATVPDRPSAPRKSMILMMSLMAGLGVGVAMVLVYEVLQNTFRTPEELEAHTGYTVMGQIPIIPARTRANVLTYLADKPTSAAVEAVRNLRTSTLLSNVDQPPQVIMSTSSLPSEGKTTQSIALAHNLSGLGKKVLLIEGDIRRRIFTQYFGISGTQGLLDVLYGDMPLKDAVVHNAQLGADVLVGAKSKTNAADVFSSDAFRKLLIQARKSYDYIIIDTPPVLVVPDARVIAQWVDAILYTVKWDHTTKRQLSEGLKSFENVNLKITGLVLAQINIKALNRYGYGDRYGAYGRYGQGYYDN